MTRKINSHVALVQFSDFSLGRGLYLAEALSLLGFKVTVITNRPVYSSDHRHRASSSLNVNIQMMDFRVPFGSALYSSIFGRLIVYIAFTFFSFMWMLRLNHKPAILYSRGPQPFTEISCIFYKLIRHDVMIISDTTDLWPEALEYVSMNRVLRSVLIAIGNSINHSIYSKTDVIVTLNETMRKVIQDRVRKKVHVIYGSLNMEEFRPIAKEDVLRFLPREISDTVDGKFVVLYAGIMNTFHSPLIITDIAEEVQNECRDIVFVAIGTGPLKEELQKIVQKKSLSNVIILNPAPYELMPFIYNVADLALFTPPELSHPTMWWYFKSALPKKFIEYAACGKPILCITTPCVSSELCLKWKAGYHVLPKDIVAAKRIIVTLKEDETLRKQLGKNAREMAIELFSTESAAAALRKIMDDEGLVSDINRFYDSAHRTKQLACDR